MPDLSLASFFPFESLLGVYCEHPVFLPEAKNITQRLQLSLLKQKPAYIDSGSFVLVVSEAGVALQATGKKAAGPVLVDFVNGAVGHRRQFGGGKGQMIAKAVGIKSSYRPCVVDVTAGLGQDAFVLATLGCEVTLVERSPIVFELLADGFSRAGLIADDELAIILQRMNVKNHDSIHYLSNIGEPIDVIYLDPMFPEKKSKAAVNKSMQAFHSLVGEDNDAGQLLRIALEKVIYRVVVKRPRKSPTIGEQFPEHDLPKPSIQFEGKSTRYDVYTRRKMPD